MISGFITGFKDKIRDIRHSVDGPLLIFLLLVLNVSLAVKLLALITIYLFRPDFKKLFVAGRLTWFYPGIALLLFIQLIFNYQRGFNYLVLFSLVFVFWSASFLIQHQLRLAIEKQGLRKVENAIAGFFIINAVITAVNLIRIMLEIHSFNPYAFTGMNFKYYDSTGDHIRGLTGDLSTVNMILNAMGVFYFLYQKRYLLSLLCMLVATCTTSNLGNFILTFFFLCILVFDRSKLNKSIIICYISILIIFIIKISPSNLNYLNNKFKSLLHLEKTPFKRKFEDYSAKDLLITNYVNRYSKLQPEKVVENKNYVMALIAEKQVEDQLEMKQSDSVYQKQEAKDRDRFLHLYIRLYGDTLTSFNKDYYERYPGKYLSFLETFRYVGKNTRHLLIGAGAGNFSSKLAFKASNIAIAGKYVKSLAYIAPEFRENHFKLTLRYYLKSISEHSVLNFPNSVFNQILGEYGIVGTFIFLLGYVWFYLKRFKQLTFGRILLPMCLIFLLTDYCFESLSFVIVFELMMFTDIIKNTTTADSSHL